MTTNLLTYLVLGLCVVVSFCLSGMEAGLFALSRLRVRRLMHSGKPSAKLLHQFLDHPENFLWTIVVGNTLVNFTMLGWLFSELQIRMPLRSVWFAVVFMLAVFLFYIFLDLLPKMLFRSYPNRLCLMLARPFRILHIGLRPVVAVAEWCSQLLLQLTGGKVFTGHLFGNREELRQAMQDSGQALSSEERAMINRVLDLENLTVHQVARPLVETISVEEETPVGEALKLFREHELTRLPVWQKRDGLRRVAGLVDLQSLIYLDGLDATRPAGSFLKPALFLDENLRLEQALEKMQRGGERLAVVLGRNGRESGVLSLHDIVKTLFGEVKL